jgi:hypothetical protein
MALVLQRGTVSRVLLGVARRRPSVAGMSRGGPGARGSGSPLVHTQPVPRTGISYQHAAANTSPEGKKVTMLSAVKIKSITLLRTGSN